MPPSASVIALAVTLAQDSFSASGKHDLVLKAYEDFKAEPFSVIWATTMRAATRATA